MKRRGEVGFGEGGREELTGADDESEEGEGVEEVGHCGRSRLGGMDEGFW